MSRVYSARRLPRSGDAAHASREGKQRSTRRAGVASRRAPLPGAGEVEIRVVAAGLNFRDVMNAVALRDDPEPLGGECAGRIVALGDGVERLRRR